MSEEIPKKIYRHILKGLQFYHLVKGSGSHLNELVSFVFLKNKRTVHPTVLQRWVKNALDSFKSNRLVQDEFLDYYRLHEAFFNGPFDNEEHFVLNPDRNHFRDENNSSQERLSESHRRNLNRKGSYYKLPKHRVRGNFKNPQHLTKQKHTKKKSSEENNLLLNVPIDEKFSTTSLHETLVFASIKSHEISSDED
ncbi:uncharacterized protein LOC121588930 [Anopheles merus]|uniref:Uncharacterized protein n=1 Tax=Anopheles merus TaxID=30066 RepID=A0A1I8JVA0_ANOME|nr:uncharacterized protein LOC121588930 [Anopheles merus]